METRRIVTAVTVDMEFDMHCLYCFIAKYQKIYQKDEIEGAVKKVIGIVWPYVVFRYIFGSVKGHKISLCHR